MMPILGPHPLIRGVESDGSDSAPQPPTTLPTPANVSRSLFAGCGIGNHHWCAGVFTAKPSGVVHCCTCACHGDANPVQDLIAAATTAARSIDRFVQLYDQRGSDLRALEQLQAALKPFIAGGAP